MFFLDSQFGVFNKNNCYYCHHIEMVGPCGIIVYQPQLIAEIAPFNCYSSSNCMCTQQVLLLHKTWVSSPVLLRLICPEFCSFCFVLFHFCVSAYFCILIVLPLLNSYSPVLSSLFSSVYWTNVLIIFLINQT